MLFRNSIEDVRFFLISDEKIRVYYFFMVDTLSFLPILQVYLKLQTKPFWAEVVGIYIPKNRRLFVFAPAD